MAQPKTDLFLSPLNEGSEKSPKIYSKKDRKTIHIRPQISSKDKNMVLVNKLTVVAF